MRRHPYFTDEDTDFQWPVPVQLKSIHLGKAEEVTTCLRSSSSPWAAGVSESLFFLSFSFFRWHYKHLLKLDVNTRVIAIRCSVLSAVFETSPKGKGPKIKKIDCLKWG